MCATRNRDKTHIHGELKETRTASKISSQDDEDVQEKKYIKKKKIL
jgi:hypothetical protein